eukprot:COSAG04_NODE_1431_length_6797_cov_2.545536_3_plen_76_part_00
MAPPFAYSNARSVKEVAAQDNENVLLPVERPDVEGNPAWTHAMFNDGNGGEFRKTFHGCESESLAQTLWRWMCLS